LEVRSKSWHFGSTSGHSYTLQGRSRKVFHHFPSRLNHAAFDCGIRDEDGYHFILGRTDDVINVAGHLRHKLRVLLAEDDAINVSKPIHPEQLMEVLAEVTSAAPEIAAHTPVSS